MTNPFASIEATIKSDLQAGVSWLEDEVVNEAHAVWNVLKGVFIALEPLEAGILMDVLHTAVKAAGSGSSIEGIETAALNTLKDEEKALFEKTGSATIQVLIAAIKAAI